MNIIILSGEESWYPPLDLPLVEDLSLMEASFPGTAEWSSPILSDVDFSTLQPESYPSEDIVGDIPLDDVPSLVSHVRYVVSEVYV